MWRDRRILAEFHYQVLEEMDVRELVLNHFASRIDYGGKVIYFSRFLVTNEQYATFLVALELDCESCRFYYAIDNDNAKIAFDPNTNKFYCEDGYRLHPVTLVSLTGAIAYCNWVGGRLPTDEEWQYVATNGKQTVFPWGDSSPDIHLANFAENVGGTTIVGSYSASLMNIYDLAGNAWEWTSTRHNGKDEDGFRRGDKNYRIRGGGWSYSAQNLKSKSIASAWANSFGNCLGFRVVFDGSAKMFKSGLVVGRFSLLHNGHVRVIERAIAECERVIIGVGYGDSVVEPRNFLTPNERKSLILDKFGDRTDKVVLIPDIKEDRQWVGHVLSCIGEKPEAVYAGSWQDLHLFEQAGQFNCRIVKRRAEADSGISGSNLRARIRRNESIVGSVPEDYVDYYITTYRKRKALFEPIMADELDQDGFQDFIVALDSIQSIFFREKWTVASMIDGADVVSLMTNKKACIAKCREMYNFYFDLTDHKEDISVYAYFTPAVPDVMFTNTENAFQGVRIHENRMACVFETDDHIQIVKTWDNRRTYLWNQDRNILIAFLDTLDGSLAYDPMRIIRGLILDSLPDEWVKVHAACVAVGNSAVLLCAEKGKGKTTTLTGLLEADNNLKLVSDDKVYINKCRGLVYGSPQAIRLGMQTIINCQSLKRPLLDERGIRKMGHIMEDGKIQLVPFDYARLLGVSIIPVGNLTMGMVLDMTTNSDTLEIVRADDSHKQQITSILRTFSDSIHPHWLKKTAKNNMSIPFPNIDWHFCKGNMADIKHFIAVSKFINDSCSACGCMETNGNTKLTNLVD